MAEDEEIPPPNEILPPNCNFPVRLTKERYIKLAAEKKERGTSMNTILNHALDCYFKLHGSKEWLKIISLK